MDVRMTRCEETQQGRCLNSYESLNGREVLWEELIAP